jgi:hypothetical protein
MQKNMDKYFWDGKQNISGEYKLKRILEYASFPDLIAYPVEELKTSSINQYRCTQNHLKNEKPFLN